MKWRLLIILVTASAVTVGLIWRWQQAADGRLAAWKAQQQDDAVFAAMQKPIELACEPLTLDRLVDRLSKATGLEFDIDTDAMKLAGVRPSNQISVDIHWPNLPAASHLSLAITPLELCWTVRRGQVLITTPEVMENLPPRVGVYPLKPGAPGPQDDTRAQVIQSVIDPSGWDNVGGRGHCELAGGAIVVAHSSEVHHQIRALLDRLNGQHDLPRTWQPIPIWPNAGQEASAELVARLRQPAAIDCQQMPLCELMEFLSQEHEVPLVLSRKKLEEASVSDQTPITAKLAGMTLHSLLLHVLKELELTFVIRDGVVQITTPEDAESQLILVAYPVHDLVVPPPLNPHDARNRDYDSLIELIASTIAPDSWDDVGGPAPIDEIGGYLLIAQTHRVHAQIESLLREIRHNLAMGEAPLLFARPQTAVAEDRIREALSRPIAATYCSTRLIDVCDDFSDQLGVSAYVSRRKLAEAGVKPESPITCDFAAAPARAQLARILEPLELTFVIRSEALVITTPEDAVSELITRVYDIRSLTESDVSLFDNDDSDTLLELITEHLHPKSWDDVGGPGSSDIFRNLLVISQTEGVHDAIQAFLAELRRAAQWRETPSIMPPTKLPPVDEGISSASTDNGAPEGVYTRIYDVRSLVEANLIDASTDRTASTPVEPFIESITAQVEPDSWSEVGGVGRVDCVHGVLIVSQTRENHVAIESLLNDLRHHPVEALPPSPVP